MSDVASELGVRGIGGVFLYTDDPKALADWYRDRLGLECEFNDTVGAYYHEFERLRDWNIEVEKEEQHDFGHFAWIRDPEGNRIELFQDFASYLPPDI
jgi:catechol 2,3-dioxygenase-like lactoylglutathione lyase family enzyme